jgi:hypothetical protein
MALQLSLLASAVLALTATVGIYWLARARAGRRLRSVLDAYVSDSVISKNSQAEAFGYREPPSSAS